MRACTAPLVVVSQRATAKMMVFNHDMLHAKRLQEAMTKAKTQEEQQRLYHALKVEYSTQVTHHRGVSRRGLEVSTRYSMRFGGLYPGLYML
jgi:hypothetical protein